MMNHIRRAAWAAIAALFLCAVWPIDATAQSSDKKADKEERKKWKKKLKGMSWQQFKRMYEDYEAVKGMTQAYTSQIKDLEGQLAPKRAEGDAKAERIAQLQAELEAIKEKMKEAVDITDQSGSEDWNKGVVYKVQIGAFRFKELKKYQDIGSFWTEEDADGVKKYTIGNFRDYGQAKAFKEAMRGLGVEDAWIVAYENGRRKDIDDTDSN